MYLGVFRCKYVRFLSAMSKGVTVVTICVENPLLNLTLMIDNNFLTHQIGTFVVLTHDISHTRTSPRKR